MDRRRCGANQGLCSQASRRRPANPNLTGCSPAPPATPTTFKVLYPLLVWLTGVSKKDINFSLRSLEDLCATHDLLSFRCQRVALTSILYLLLRVDDYLLLLLTKCRLHVSFIQGWLTGNRLNCYSCAVTLSNAAAQPYSLVLDCYL